MDVKGSDNTLMGDVAVVANLRGLVKDDDRDRSRNDGFAVRLILGISGVE